MESWKLKLRGNWNETKGKIKQAYGDFTDNDLKHFVNDHWGYDIGAFQMADALAKELKCVFVHSLYSRLLLDPNRSIVSDSLFRKKR